MLATMAETTSRLRRGKRLMAAETVPRPSCRCGRPFVGFSRLPVCHQLQLVGPVAEAVSGSRLQPDFSIKV